MVEDEYASLEEATAAIQALTDEDHQRLVLISRFWHRQRKLFRLGVDPLELLSEAFESTLAAGGRRWRKARVTIVQHLDQSMRSISGHHIEKARTLAEAKKEVRGLAVIRGRSPHTSVVEAQAAARSEIEAIRAVFSDDASALRVLECRADGMSAEEIQTALSLSKTQYATVNRRIIRKLVKYSLTS